MNIGDRIKEERVRLGLNQFEFGKLAGVSKTTQFNYEKGDRQPDAAYLAAVAAIGVDVMYVITGTRRVDPELSPEEIQLLSCYRDLGPEQRASISQVSETMAAIYKANARGK
ncbi:helix-turn-helix domain-containing protein [Marinobacterium sp. D7]|uniref:helix-turn-helix domain-containing protein n=1 Tax=Marinobacterium ramblicola TaxID=2849041 RepID=UPI001C2CE78B|nr:helix-turn-helix domain-containing protein [Marinobacterium ramblicola]MBV1790237.1 helix-turn-helix domain-containing protein [Marinobacterium ramblicola]